MIVEQIWTGNAYRNFNYLIACPETGEALAIDPLDHQKCLSLAKQRGFTITQILNTHEHGDHVGGNKAMVRETGAKVLAHANGKGRVPEQTEGLAAGDVVRVGKRVELEVLDTPGHTMAHVCLLSRTERPALFCGDTLFNAGAGNCHNGGHPNELFQTFSEQLSRLSDDTLIYPGHDYIENNLQFTLDREPDNKKAQELLLDISGQDPDQAMVTTIGLEREINTFFRLDNATVIRQLQASFADIGEAPDPKTVFLKLRELRNDW
ncbi:MAG: hydroxyacylglutathione hydrolase [Magnetovibrionaceae bacterium]